MKAATHSQYGPPEVLKIVDIPQPQPKPGEILVRVKACTINRTDCANLLAKPFIMRFFNGLFSPRNPIPGTDFAGIVEDVGRNVKKFKVGERVFGFDDGGLSSQAEFLVISAKKAIHQIPSNCSFDTAIASVEGAHYALNFINKVKVKPGDKVLINGGTGAIGSALVQFSKNKGAILTAVCRAEHFEKMKILGADKVIDYTKEDFTEDNDLYEYIFDSVGKSTFFKCKKILKKTGTYISSELGPFVQNPFLSFATPLVKRKQVRFPIPFHPEKSLEQMAQLIQEGKFKPLIDRVYPLEKVKEAYEYVLTGQKVGNVILKMD
ncbi:NAD(P)-dependent alcohol dehydrogenase [Echinicola jeungdonensis]|uniref:NAD(P)-dependent alcohol dehydrogenase n=1 Tax=Echinicola jeungdonensis TaxID=709343 RepID=A0ABV5J2B9_9BACT|nr:NAD(P)-dependent alcohol dehydrogenase [Echinicola jeungdonensis]MDN3667820.1 NAD(P)-dependent alcohol dehydrogenase [Echinicola jeungdonensis]